jgi:hypothetical protein
MRRIWLLAVNIGLACHPDTVCRHCVTESCFEPCDVGGKAQEPVSDSVHRTVGTAGIHPVQILLPSGHQWFMPVILTTGEAAQANSL